jgi:hypothetical protein
MIRPTRPVLAQNAYRAPSWSFQRDAVDVDE